MSEDINKKFGDAIRAKESRVNFDMLKPKKPEGMNNLILNWARLNG